jgi:Icc-related predicted phosphoesterase
MEGRNGTVRVAALGDIHVHEGQAGTYRELLTDVAHRADVLILCGDLTNRGTPKEADVLVEELSACRNMPIVAVLGNHDFESGQQEEVSDILCRAGVAMLDNEPCEIQGVGFAGVKGFCGGFGTHMLAPWGEDLIKVFVRQTIDETLLLESGLGKLRTRNKIAVLHYAPVADTVQGEPPEIFPFLGASRLAEPADRFGVAAIFHGHAHNGTHQGKTAAGIPVYNVSLPLMRRVNPEHPYVVMEL